MTDEEIMGLVCNLASTLDLELPDDYGKAMDEPALMKYAREQAIKTVVDLKHLAYAIYEIGHRAEPVTLCFNCGVISPDSSWTYLAYDPENDQMIDVHFAPDGMDTSDPHMICPHCKWEHTDDDGNPGIYPGPRAEVELHRERELADPECNYAQWWAETNKELEAGND